MRLRITLFGLVLMIALAASGCGGGGGPAESLVLIPDDDYSVIVVARPAKLLKSPFISTLIEEYGKDPYSNFLDEFEDNTSSNFDTTKSLAFAGDVKMAGLAGKGEPVAEFILQMDGTFDDDDMIDSMEKPDAWEDDKQGGFKYYKNTNNETGMDVAFGILKNGIIGGTENLVEDSIDLLHGDGDSIKRSLDYRKASILVDSKADIWILFLDLGRNSKATIDQALASFPNDPGYKDLVTILKLVKKVENASISLTFSKNMKMVIKLQLDDKEDAEEMAEMIDDYAKFVAKTAANYIPIPDFNAGAMTDEISVKAKGSIVEIITTSENIDKIIE